MNLQGIVAVSGKPGLWKALTQNKTGFILESLDEQKTKLVANLSTAKLAALDEITIFGYDDDIRLTDVFEKMKITPNVPDAKADGRQLREYFRVVAPDHDEEKVYASDMKKVVSWYHIMKDMPFFNEEEKPAEAEVAPVVEQEPEAVIPAQVAGVEPVAVEAEPAKPAAKPKKAAPKATEADATEEKPAAKAAKPKAKKAE
jgi:hypothetical protein